MAALSSFTCYPLSASVHYFVCCSAALPPNSTCVCTFTFNIDSINCALHFSYKPVAAKALATPRCSRSWSIDTATIDLATFHIRLCRRWPSATMSRPMNDEEVLSEMNKMVKAPFCKRHASPQSSSFHRLRSSSKKHSKRLVRSKSRQTKNSLSKRFARPQPPSERYTHLLCCSRRSGQDCPPRVASN